ncbi:hypothetical protein M0R72_01130 [Candidatus Pacearchaeota archaeon]|jgi:hypothetical protein|nr:hypothetical protein [Candidatus Pacearchaeota archaeon]
MFKSIDLSSLESTWAYAPGEEVSPGVWVTWTHNFENFYLTKEFESFCECTLAATDGVDPLKWFVDSGFRSTYGVCDSPEQFLASDVYKFYNERPEEFIATLTEVRKDDQPKQGGWRWHKWGPYIGTHEKQFEYLADEEGIERVFCYHIVLRVSLKERLGAITPED